MWVWSLGQENTLEKGMTTHSSILAWEITWTEEPGGLQSMEVTRVRHDLATKQQQQIMEDMLWRVPSYSFKVKRLGAPTDWWIGWGNLQKGIIPNTDGKQISTSLLSTRNKLKGFADFYLTVSWSGKSTTYHFIFYNNDRENFCLVWFKETIFLRSLNRSCILKDNWILSR